MNTNTLTVIQLFSFKPLNDKESELFNFDRGFINKLIADLSNNFFYLGGHIKMNADDSISINSINLVKEIMIKRDIEYGPPANGAEYGSILRSKRQLEIIENMIIKYNEIITLREKETLDNINKNYNI